MFNKSKRILWLLNHRTLMPYEAPLIQRLGFEIYIPKIYPKSGFRSGAIDASYDAPMTLPPRVIESLNKFNFYEDRWTSEIIEMANRYFGCAFIIPHARLSQEVIDNFENQIVFRAFGLDNDKTYKQFLENLYGPLILRKIHNIEHRFWFGEGYDHLHEIEEPIFVRRSLFLPIGIPESYFSSARQWTGAEKKLLFICPNAVTDSYYSKIYREFKRDFGDLPHVIVGAQDVPVPDPHVAGFVTDAELRRLYLECAVLYYHSTEVRHVHYSPIEAAINGMPVVYHAGSLLDRLSRGANKGRVNSVVEARVLIERLLAGDKRLIAEIKGDQQEIAYHFSDAYCGPMWHKQMEERGFYKALRKKSALKTWLTEVWRTLIGPLAHGRTRVDPHGRAVAPVKATLTSDEARAEYGSSLFDGIEFAASSFPAVVDFVDGVGANEHWGRWSNDEKIVIVLKHKLEGKFRFFLRAVGYRDNAGAHVPVRIGSQTSTVRLPSSIEDATGAWLHFDLAKPSNIIEITVPHPITPEMDTRKLGIGMVAVGASPEVTLGMDDARQLLGASLQDGWHFGLPSVPVFVDGVQGLGGHEHWGRWSIGDTVVFELKHNLEGRFELFIQAVGLGPNAEAPVRLRIGSQERTVKLPAQPGGEIGIKFALRAPANVIQIYVPFPYAPPGEARVLGIGFYSLRVA